MPRDINPVPFRPERPERPVPVGIPGQNGDVFVPGRIPDRSGRSGQIPAGMPRFCTGGSVPEPKTTSLAAEVGTRDPQMKRKHDVEGEGEERDRVADEEEEKIDSFYPLVRNVRDAHDQVLTGCKEKGK